MTRPSPHGLAIVLCAALLAASCGNDTGDSRPAPTTSGTVPVVADASGGDESPDDGGFAGSLDLVLDQDLGCELLGRECLLPFPSDALTVDDASSATGRRVALPASLMPANSAGVRVDSSRQNRADGFSPGSAALVLIPGIDPVGSALPPVTDMARSLADGSGSVVIDATTGER
jgi:hypothetical protein